MDLRHQRRLRTRATKRVGKAGQFIAKQMPPKQIEEAEQQALQWLSRLKKISPLLGSA